MKQRFVAGDDAGGKRLDAWLAVVAGIARREAGRLAGQGSVVVGGRPAPKSHRLQPGEVVEVERSSPEASQRPELPEIAVKFEDDDLAVVSKPAGVVVHGAPPSLVDALRERMNLAPAGGSERPGIIHRLDKYTSGLLVVAKTDRAFESLSREMRRRTIARTYLALVAGLFSMPTGRIEAPVGRSEASPTRMKVGGRGRNAITEFRVDEAFAECSLVEVNLITGRTHQIRVHFAHIKHPVVGDEVYGPRTHELAARLGLDRPFLHATKLRFPHPISSEEIVVEDDLPQGLSDALQQLRESE